MNVLTSVLVIIFLVVSVVCYAIVASQTNYAPEMLGAYFALIIAMGYVAGYEEKKELKNQAA